MTQTSKTTAGQQILILNRGIEVVDSTVGSGFKLELEYKEPATTGWLRRLVDSSYKNGSIVFNEHLSPEDIQFPAPAFSQMNFIQQKKGNAKGNTRGYKIWRDLPDGIYEASFLMTYSKSARAYFLILNGRLFGEVLLGDAGKRAAHDHLKVLANEALADAMYEASKNESPADEMVCSM